jgi:Kelch motif
VNSVLAAFLLIEAMTIGPATDRSPAGRWSSGPFMAAPQVAAMSVTLQDGRILVAGGYTDIYDWPTPAAQIYDPQTDSWSLLPPMAIGRAGATATLLRDGRVLVVGGLGPALKPLQAAEIFNQTTNTWNSVASLPDTRFAHSASLLSSGRVLIAGGIVNGRISSSTLLFNPVAGTWSSGPRMHVPHALQASVTLAGGRVLLAGGYGRRPEYYRPRAHAWTALGSAPRRTRPTVTDLADGSVLMAAGESRKYHDLRSAEVFNPIRKGWVASGPMHQQRNSAMAIRLATGEVLVVGGEQVTGRVLRSAELYEPANHSWIDAPPLAHARSGAIIARLQDGRVLLCGGVDFGDSLSSCEVYTR